MKLKGRPTKPARHITVRLANPEIDRDARGRPLAHGVAFVYRLDAEAEGLYNTPAIPLTYGATWYAYGNWRKRTRGPHEQGLLYDGVWYDVYATCPKYHCKDGRVYTATLHAPIDEVQPEERDRILARMDRAERAHFERTRGRAPHQEHR